MITDFHSHILPNMDDGSQSVEESIKLLQMLSEQNVHTVYATPHFYPTKENPKLFLERREQAFLNLKEASQGLELPQVLLGAEVAYFPGISRMKELYDLRFEGSKILLLEMSMEEWTEYTLRELTEISCMGGITLLVAHGERYRKYQKKDAWYRLLDLGVFFQSNASNFVNIKTRKKALKQLENNEIHLIGSDCHNLEDRKPNMAEAFEIIKAKYGDQMLMRMESFYTRTLVKTKN